MSVARANGGLAEPKHVGRVIHVVPAVFGEDGVYGGAERYVWELARHMADRTPTTLLAYAEKAREWMDGKLAIRTVPRAFSVRGQAGNPFSFRMFAEIWRHDVIHFHQSHLLQSNLGALMARLLRKRAYVSDLGGGGWDLSAYFKTDRWFHGHLHISDYSRRVNRHDQCRRAHVIWGGIDTGRFVPGLATGDRDRVVYVGRLLPHKGIDYLIQGLPAGIPLEIIGRVYDRDYYDRLKRLARGRRVSFRHDLDDGQIIEAYQRSFYVVLPSVYRSSCGRETKVPELLGQTLMEGMACGAPGLATDVASLPEVVSDGRTGHLVPPNDAGALGHRIEEMSRSPAKVRRLGLRARQDMIERFSWPVVVERCLRLYRASN